MCLMLRDMAPCQWVVYAALYSNELKFSAILKKALDHSGYCVCTCLLLYHFNTNCQHVWLKTLDSLLGQVLNGS